MTNKLIYILPEASEKTHMKYNLEFVTALAKEKGVRICLILERGYEVGSGMTLEEYLSRIKERTGVKDIYYTGTRVLTRIPRLIYFLIKASLMTYKKVYIHYSFVGAFAASLNPLFTTYYWNCGMPWQYKRPVLQELYESTTYKLISHFVTGANILTEKYSDYYKFNNKKSIVIPNWIDVEKTTHIKNNTDKERLKSELIINTNQKVLFFNQRLSERKGAHYILPILKSSPENVIVVITNDGPYKETLLRELNENNFENRVRILGKVTNEKVIQLMSITDIYILPSEEEGMSHSFMEAMCSSVPTVSFAVGCTADMYPMDTREFAIEIGDVHLFVNKVNELLADEGKARLLGLKLYNKVKEYDKNRILEDFVNKVLR